MSLGFINDAYNRATGTLNAFGALSDALVREGRPPMVSRSGDREYADQLKIWNERMVLAGDIRGRHVYAKKRWQGKTWYQIHPDTVATPTNPPTSNHGKRRSNDLTWPYNDASTAAHKRARVLAPRYGISCEGLGFSRPEDWHWTFWGVLGAIISPASLPGSNDIEPAPEPEKEDEDMDYRPTVHARLAADGKTQDEWMLGHPDIGKDLPVFDGTATDKNSRLSADKKVKTFRGFMVTVNRDIFTAWARTHGKGTSQITSSTDRDGYIEIQKELSRVSGELGQSTAIINTPAS